MATQKNSYLKNIGRSIAFSIKKVAEDKTPALYDLANDQNQEFMKNVLDTVKDIRRGQMGLKKIIEANESTRAVKEALGGAIDDIKHGLKTGELQRDHDEYMEEAMGMDMNFGDDDFGLSEDGEFNFDDLPDPESLNVGADATSAETTASEIGAAEIDAINEGTKATVSVGLRNVDAIGKLEKAEGINATMVSQSVLSGSKATNANILQMLNLQKTYHSQDLSAFQTLNDNIANLVGFHNDKTATFYESSMKYQTGVLEALGKITATLDRVYPEKNEYRNDYETDYDKAGLGYNRAINIGGYIDIVKRNLKNNTMAGQMLSMIDDPTVLKDMLSNPLQSLLNMGVQAIIPRVLDESMKRLNDTFSNFIPAMLNKLAGFATDTSAPQWLQTIGSIFGIQSATFGPNLGGYDKGPRPFDGITHRTINYVIPRYLSKMVSLLGGKEMVYNASTGTFKSSEAIKEDYENRMKNKQKYAGSSDLLRTIREDEYMPFLGNEKNDPTGEKTKKEWLAMMDQFARNAATTPGFHDLSDRKVVKELLGDMKDGMPAPEEMVNWIVDDLMNRKELRPMFMAMSKANLEYSEAMNREMKRSDAEGDYSRNVVFDNFEGVDTRRINYDAMQEDQYKLQRLKEGKNFDAKRQKEIQELEAKLKNDETIAKHYSIAAVGDNTSGNKKLFGQTDMTQVENLLATGNEVRSSIKADTESIVFLLTKGINFAGSVITGSGSGNPPIPPVGGSGNPPTPSSGPNMGLDDIIDTLKNSSSSALEGIEEKIADMQYESDEELEDLNYQKEVEKVKAMNTSIRTLNLSEQINSFDPEQVKKLLAAIPKMKSYNGFYQNYKPEDGMYNYLRAYLSDPDKGLKNGKNDAEETINLIKDMFKQLSPVEARLLKQEFPEIANFDFSSIYNNTTQPIQTEEQKAAEAAARQAAEQKKKELEEKAEESKKKYAEAKKEAGKKNQLNLKDYRNSDDVKYRVEQAMEKRATAKAKEDEKKHKEAVKAGKELPEGEIEHGPLKTLKSMIQSPMKALGVMFDKFDDAMFSLLFGKQKDPRSLLSAFTKGIHAGVTDILKVLNEDFLKPFKAALLFYFSKGTIGDSVSALWKNFKAETIGVKDERRGVYVGGMLSGVANTVTLAEDKVEARKAKFAAKNATKAKNEAELRKYIIDKYKALNGREPTKEEVDQLIADNKKKQAEEKAKEDEKKKQQKQQSQSSGTSEPSTSETNESSSSSDSTKTNSDESTSPPVPPEEHPSSDENKDESKPPTSATGRRDGLLKYIPSKGGNGLGEPVVTKFPDNTFGVANTSEYIDNRGNIFPTVTFAEGKQETTTPKIENAKNIQQNQAAENDLVNRLEDASAAGNAEVVDQQKETNKILKEMNNRDAEVVKADKDKSVWGGIKERVNNMTTGIFDDFRAHIFGEDTVKKENGERRTLVDSVMSMFSKGANNFSNAVFGTNYDTDTAKKEYEKQFKAAIPKGIARGLVIGGGLALTSMAGPLGGFGLLGSLFLPGGIIGSLVLGLGAGLALESDKVKNFLFGPQDADGKRTGGLVPKKVIDFVQKNKRILIGGGMLGLIQGISGFSIIGGLLGLLPGGAALAALPALGIAGAGPVLVSMGAALAIKSESFQNALFGKQDPVTQKKVGGLLQSKAGQAMKQFLPNAAFGAAIGGIGMAALGSFGILGGLALAPSTGALLGAAVGIGLASNKFKEMMFGKIDENGNYVSGGLISKFNNFMNVEFFTPAKNFFAEQTLKTKKWFNDKVISKIAWAMTPYKIFIKNIFKKGEQHVTDLFKGIGRVIRGVFSPLIDPVAKLAKDMILGIKTLFGKSMNLAAGAMREAISAPISILTAPASWLGDYYRNEGTDEERAQMADADEAKKKRDKAVQKKYDKEMEELTDKMNKDNKLRDEYRKSGYNDTEAQLKAKTDARQEKIAMLAMEQRDSLNKILDAAAPSEEHLKNIADKVEASFGENGIKFDPKIFDIVKEGMLDKDNTELLKMLNQNPEMGEKIQPYMQSFANGLMELANFRQGIYEQSTALDQAAEMAERGRIFRRKFKNGVPHIVKLSDKALQDNARKLKGKNKVDATAAPTVDEIAATQAAEEVANDPNSTKAHGGRLKAGQSAIVSGDEKVKANADGSVNIISNPLSSNDKAKEEKVKRDLQGKTGTKVINQGFALNNPSEKAVERKELKELAHGSGNEKLSALGIEEERKEQSYRDKLIAALMSIGNKVTAGTDKEESWWDKLKKWLMPLAGILGALGTLGTIAAIGTKIYELIKNIGKNGLFGGEDDESGYHSDQLTEDIVKRGAHTKAGRVVFRKGIEYAKQLPIERLKQAGHLAWGATKVAGDAAMGAGKLALQTVKLPYQATMAVAKGELAAGKWIYDQTLGRLVPLESIGQGARFIHDNTIGRTGIYDKLGRAKDTVGRYAERAADFTDDARYAVTRVPDKLKQRLTFEGSYADRANKAEVYLTTHRPTLEGLEEKIADMQYDTDKELKAMKRQAAEESAEYARMGKRAEFFGKAAQKGGLRGIDYKDIRNNEGLRLHEKIIAIADKFIDALRNSKALKKITGDEGAIVKIANKIKEAVSKVTPDVVKKYAGTVGKKIAAGLSRTAGAVATMGGSIALFGMYDFYNGAENASTLFRVDPEDVTPGMTKCAAFFNAFMGLPYVWIVDIILELAYALGGMDIKPVMLKFIYEAFGGTEDIEKLQAKYEQNYKQWASQAWNEGKTRDDYDEERKKQTEYSGMGNVVRDTFGDNSVITNMMVGHKDENGDKRHGIGSAISQAWKDSSLVGTLATGGLNVIGKTVKNQLFGSTDNEGNYTKGILSDTTLGKNFNRASNTLFGDAHPVLNTMDQNSIPAKQAVLKSMGIDPAIYTEREIREWDSTGTNLPRGETMSPEQVRANEDARKIREAVASNIGSGDMRLESINYKRNILKSMMIDESQYSDAELANWHITSGTLPRGEQISNSQKQALDKMQKTKMEITRALQNANFNTSSVAWKRSLLGMLGIDASIYSDDLLNAWDSSSGKLPGSDKEFDATQMKKLEQLQEMKKDLVAQADPSKFDKNSLDYKKTLLSMIGIPTDVYSDNAIAMWNPDDGVLPDTSDLTEEQKAKLNELRDMSFINYDDLKEQYDKLSSGWIGQIGDHFNNMLIKLFGEEAYEGNEGSAGLLGDFRGSIWAAIFGEADVGDYKGRESVLVTITNKLNDCVDYLFGNPETGQEGHILEELEGLGNKILKFIGFDDEVLEGDEIKKLNLGDMVLYGIDQFFETNMFGNNPDGKYANEDDWGTGIWEHTFGAIGSALWNVGGKVVDLISGAITGLGNAIVSAFDWVTNGAEGFKENVLRVTTEQGILSGFIDVIFNLLRGAFGLEWSDKPVKDSIDGFFEAIVGKDSIIYKITSLITNVGSGLVKIGEKLVNVVQHKLKSILFGDDTTTVDEEGNEIAAENNVGLIERASVSLIWNIFGGKNVLTGEEKDPIWSRVATSVMDGLQNGLEFLFGKEFWKAKRDTTDRGLIGNAVEDLRWNIFGGKNAVTGKDKDPIWTRASKSVLDGIQNNLEYLFGRSFWKNDRDTTDRGLIGNAVEDLRWNIFGGTNAVTGINKEPVWVRVGLALNKGFHLGLRYIFGKDIVTGANGWPTIVDAGDNKPGLIKEFIVAIQKGFDSGIDAVFGPRKPNGAVWDRKFNQSIFAKKWREFAKWIGTSIDSVIKSLHDWAEDTKKWFKEFDLKKWIKQIVRKSLEDKAKESGFGSTMAKQLLQYIDSDSNASNGGKGDKTVIISNSINSKLGKPPIRLGGKASVEQINSEDANKLVVPGNPEGGTIGDSGCSVMAVKNAVNSALGTDKISTDDARSFASTSDIASDGSGITMSYVDKAVSGLGAKSIPINPNNKEALKYAASTGYPIIGLGQSADDSANSMYTRNGHFDVFKGGYTHNGEFYLGEQADSLGRRAPNEFGFSLDQVSSDSNSMRLIVPDNTKDEEKVINPKKGKRKHRGIGGWIRGMFGKNKREEIFEITPKEGQFTGNQFITDNLNRDTSLLGVTQDKITNFTGSEYFNDGSKVATEARLYPKGVSKLSEVAKAVGYEGMPKDDETLPVEVQQALGYQNYNPIRTWNNYKTDSAMWQRGSGELPVDRWIANMAITGDDGTSDNQEGIGGKNTMFMAAQSSDECTRQAAAALWNAYTGENTTAGEWGGWYGTLKSSKLNVKEDDYSKDDRNRFESNIEAHFNAKPNNPVYLYQTGGDGNRVEPRHPLNRGSGNHATVIGRKLNNGHYEVYDSNGGIIHELTLNQLFDPSAEGSAKNRTDYNSSNITLTPQVDPSSPITEWSSTNGKSDGVSLAEGASADASVVTSKNSNNSNNNSGEIFNSVANTLSQQSPDVLGKIAKHAASFYKAMGLDLLMPSIFGNSSATNANGIISNGNGQFSSTGDTVKDLWNYLISNGYTKYAAAGILGPWQSESNINPKRVEGDYMSGFPGYDEIATNAEARNAWSSKIWANTSIQTNHDAYRADDGNYYPGFGLAQWTGPRGKRLLDFANSNNGKWYDPGIQIKFFNDEMGGSYKKVKEDINAASSVDDATYLFTKYYEGNPDSVMSEYLPPRRKAANEIYEKYKDVVPDSNSNNINGSNASSAQGPVSFKDTGDALDYYGGYMADVAKNEWHRNIPSWFWRGIWRQESGNLTSYQTKHWNNPMGMDYSSWQSKYGARPAEELSAHGHTRAIFPDFESAAKAEVEYMLAPDTFDDYKNETSIIENGGDLVDAMYYHLRTYVGREVDKSQIPGESYYKVMKEEKDRGDIRVANKPDIIAGAGKKKTGFDIGINKKISMPRKILNMVNVGGKGIKSKILSWLGKSYAGNVSYDEAISLIKNKYPNIYRFGVVAGNIDPLSVVSMPYDKAVELDEAIASGEISQEDLAHVNDYNADSYDMGGYGKGNSMIYNPRDKRPIKPHSRIPLTNHTPIVTKGGKGKTFKPEEFFEYHSGGKGLGGKTTIDAGHSRRNQSTVDGITGILGGLFRNKYEGMTPEEKAEAKKKEKERRETYKRREGGVKGFFGGLFGTNPRDIKRKEVATNKKLDAPKKEIEVIDIEAPNGKKYEKNDVDYLLKNGYTQDDALKLLAESEKYKKKDEKVDEKSLDIKAPNGNLYEKNDVDYLLSQGYSQDDALKLLAEHEKYKKRENIDEDTKAEEKVESSDNKEPEKKKDKKVPEKRNYGRELLDSFRSLNGKKSLAEEEKEVKEKKKDEEESEKKILKLQTVKNMKRMT